MGIQKPGLLEQLIINGGLSFVPIQLSPDTTLILHIEDRSDVETAKCDDSDVARKFPLDEGHFYLKRERERERDSVKPLFTLSVEIILFFGGYFHLSTVLFSQPFTCARKFIENSDFLNLHHSEEGQAIPFAQCVCFVFVQLGLSSLNMFNCIAQLSLLH